MLRRAALNVTASEPVGPYTLVRVERGPIDPGDPGQFFMLSAPGRLLPRPMSLCLAPPHELAFLIDDVGPGTHALTGVERGDTITVFGPLGRGFRLDVERPLLVGGGVWVAPFPYVSERLNGPPAILGFRTAWHAEAAALVPAADVILEPAYVTEAVPAGRDVLACGPEPMLEAVRALAPDSHLAC
jgi:dihydroorotate dehydrogenase electron transfer subunit